MSDYHKDLAWRVRGLTGTEKLVLVYIASQADKQGICSRGQGGIARSCCLTVRTVRDVIKSLEAKG